MLIKEAPDLDLDMVPEVRSCRISGYIWHAYSNSGGGGGGLPLFWNELPREEHHGVIFIHALVNWRSHLPPLLFLCH